MGKLEPSYQQQAITVGEHCIAIMEDDSRPEGCALVIALNGQNLDEGERLSVTELLVIKQAFNSLEKMLEAEHDMQRWNRKLNPTFEVLGKPSS